MGPKKQTGGNPFIRVFLVVFTWFALSGCQQISYPKVSMESADTLQANESLRRAAGHILARDLNSALTESNKALKSFPPELRQKALFQKGVIYGYPDGEIQDLNRAVFYFEIAEKEENDTTIQAYSKFMKDVLKLVMVQQKGHKSLEKNLATLTHKHEALLGRQDKRREAIQRLETENAALKTRVAALVKEMKDNEEKGFEEVIIQQEPLTQ